MYIQLHILQYVCEFCAYEGPDESQEGLWLVSPKKQYRSVAGYVTPILRFRGLGFRVLRYRIEG